MTRSNLVLRLALALTLGASCAGDPAQVSDGALVIDAKLD